MTESSGALDITIPENLHGERLDRALVQLLPEFSRTRLKNLILAGAVSEGDDILLKPDHKVAANDILGIEIPPSEDATPQPEKIPLNVLFEDSDLIVIDKPAGLVVHPAPGNWTGTLVNALLHHCGETLSGINGVRRPGIVHRLDKDTSGVMVATKNDAAHRGLAEQFVEHGRDGTLERSYLAFAWGSPPFGKLRIDAPMGRDPANRLKMKVTEKGRPAITHVELVESYGAQKIVSKFRCRLDTGRTHQIRVHLGHEGHPLLGDELYGAGFKTKAALLSAAAQNALADLNRQALHAESLGFIHPRSGERLRFESPLPADLRQLQAALAAL